MRQETAEKKISEKTRLAIKDALTRYYRGECSSLLEAFQDSDDISRGHYYRLKAENPAEIDALDAEVRQAVIQEKTGAQLRLAMRMTSDSLEAQVLAGGGLLAAIPHIAAIARGESREVEFLDKDGETYTKRIAAYPRDMIQAAKVLQEIARGGTLPELILDSSAAEDRRGMLDPTKLLAPPRHDFSRAEITKPDGTKVTVSIEAGEEVIDGETEDASS